MIAVNNSAGSTGRLRVSCTGRENQGIQRGHLGKKEEEACNGAKTYPRAGALSWGVRHRCTTFPPGAGQSGPQTVGLRWGFSGQSRVEKDNETSQTRPGPGEDLRKLLRAFMHLHGKPQFP